MLVLFGLFLLQEIDNEILVVLNEVIRKPLLLQVVPKVFSPFRIKSLQYSELGWCAMPVGSSKERCRRGAGSRRLGWCWRRGMPMSSEDAAQQAVFVTRVCSWRSSAEGCRLGLFARILFPVVHLLQELLGFLLVEE